MKSKSKSKTRTFSFPDDIYREAQRQAKAANRSVSNYLATLILEHKAQTQ